MSGSAPADPKPVPATSTAPVVERFSTAWSGAPQQPAATSRRAEHERIRGVDPARWLARYGKVAQRRRPARP